METIKSRRILQPEYTLSNHSFEKKRLKGFWKYKWVFLTLNQWVNIFNDERDSFSIRQNKEKARKTLGDALKKMVLEKRITESERLRLNAMIDAKDKESVYTALVIFGNLNRNKFKKR